MKHQPVSPFERSMFHRGSVGALRFNSAPILAGVQAIAPTSPAGISQAVDSSMIRALSGIQVWNPALIMDGRSRRTPRALVVDRREIPPPHALVEGESGNQFMAPDNSLSMDLTYTLPAGWRAIYLITAEGLADVLRRKLSFVY